MASIPGNRVYLGFTRNQWLSHGSKRRALDTVGYLLFRSPCIELLLQLLTKVLIQY